MHGEYKAPAAVLKSRKLSGTAKIIYSILCGLADDKGRVYCRLGDFRDITAGAPNVLKRMRDNRGLIAMKPLTSFRGASEGVYITIRVLPGADGSGALYPCIRMDTARLKDISGSSRLVLNDIVYYTDSEGYTEVSARDLSDRYGLSVNSVLRILRTLEGKGYIVRGGRKFIKSPDLPEQRARAVIPVSLCMYSPRPAKHTRADASP